MTMAHVDALAQEYLKIQEEEDSLDDRKKKLNKELKELLPEMADVSIDDKENMYIITPNKVEIKLEKRSSVSLNQEAALTYAEKRGLEKKLTYTQRIADPQSFEALCLQGVISDKDYQSIVDIKESVALKIKKIS